MSSVFTTLTAVYERSSHVPRTCDKKEGMIQYAEEDSSLERLDFEA